MRRTRGFTLMEILIAMSLTAIVTASVLALVRTQLNALELNDQIVRTQQGTRAGIDLMEGIVRRACGAIPTGAVQVYTPNVISATGVPCLRWYDGATVGASSFTATTTTKPDALEVVYATGTMTALTGHANLMTNAPSIDVLNSCDFSVGDYVILTDASYANPVLFKVSNVTGSGSCPHTGTLSLGTLSAAPSFASPVLKDCTVDTSSSPAQCKTAGTPVFKAATYSFFVVTDNTSPYYQMLMVDPGGVASTNHLDYGNAVQPALEGVVDFQVAVGNDTSGNGVIEENTGSPSTDEWIGNASGETILDPVTNPWNSSNLATMPQLRQVRIGLTLQTSNQYAGVAATPSKLEDGQTLTSTATYGPRYRSMRIVVAPRAWNLTE